MEEKDVLSALFVLGSVKYQAEDYVGAEELFKDALCLARKFKNERIMNACAAFIIWSQMAQMEDK